MERNSVGKIFALIIGASLLATLVVWGLHPSKRVAAQKTTIGNRDAVYYYHAATREDAERVGRALVATGFLNDRGTTVVLSKGSGGTVLSFVVNNGAWDRPQTITSFEEIGRRVAPAAGGFPIKVRLVDSSWVLRKELTIGRMTIGSKDEIYYFGSATEDQAQTLGRALQAAGFFADRGASVVLAKDGGTSISFVLDEGAWLRADAVAGFTRLVQQVAGALGGLPVQVRLLNPKMAPEKEWMVR